MVFMMALTSCNYIPPLSKDYVKKTELVQQIAKLNTEHQTQLDLKTTEIKNLYEIQIGSLENQLQAGANLLYGAHEAFKYYQAPNRLNLIIDNRVTEAQSAMGRAPTYEAIKAENLRLQNELDEKKTTIEQLNAAHVEKIKEVTKLSEETLLVKKQLETAKSEYLAIEQDYIKKNGELQKQLNDANDKIQKDQVAALAAETEKNNNNAAIERMKTKLMWACGAGALACLLGAIYSPVGKEGFAIIGGSLGLATVAIPYIQGWMILTAIIVIILGTAVVFAYKHNLLSKTNVNMVHAIQDDIEQGSTTIKKNLSAWNTKYVTNADGTITEVPDTAIKRLITSTLMQIGRLTTDKSSTSGSNTPSGSL